jgi:hypothetical protein
VNRRGFLEAAALAVAGLAIDPERLIWTPGAKTIIIPLQSQYITATEIVERGPLANFPGSVDYAIEHFHLALAG